MQPRTKSKVFTSVDIFFHSVKPCSIYSCHNSATVNWLLVDANSTEATWTSASIREGRLTTLATAPHGWPVRADQLLFVFLETRTIAPILCEPLLEFPLFSFMVAATELATESSTPFSPRIQFAFQKGKTQLPAKQGPRCDTVWGCSLSGCLLAELAGLLWLFGGDGNVPSQMPRATQNFSLSSNNA